MKASTASLRAALAALALATVGAAAAMAGPAGGHRGHHGMPPPDAPGHAMLGERLLDSVKATPEQKQRVEAIQRAARDDLRKLRDGDRSLREQTMAALASPTIDTTRLEALRQQQLANHDQASQRMLQAMIDTAQVLTPEQRTQLAERAQQRREARDPRRSDRPAAASAPSR